MHIFWRRKLTRVELALYAGIVGVAIGVFSERLLYYMELAERTSMMVTVSQVNSAIHLGRAVAMLRGQSPASPAGGDPFELAGITPRNFMGAVDRPSLALLERGVWIFDRSAGEAIYLPRLHRQLMTDDPHQAIRFRLMPPSSGAVPVLVPTSKFTWG